MLFAKTSDELQKYMNILLDSTKWKLTENTNKTNKMSFHDGRLPAGLRFCYNGIEVEIVFKLSQTQSALSGQLKKQYLI